jgi:hypothetical protein
MQGKCFTRKDEIEVHHLESIAGNPMPCHVSIRSRNDQLQMLLQVL